MIWSPINKNQQKYHATFVHCQLNSVKCDRKHCRPCPHVSGDFYIRKFFYADTPSVHTCPPYTLGVSGDFCIRSPEWKFLYTLCIRIRVDARIRIFLYTLTSQYQNQSFSARDFLKWRRAETLCVQCY